MGEIIKKIATIAMIMGVFLSVALTLGLLMFAIYGAIGVVLNASVLADVLYFVQMWLPFNLAPVMAITMYLVNLYLAYNIAKFVYRYVSSFIKD